MRVRAVLLFSSATLFPLTPCPAITVADISQHPVARLTNNGVTDRLPALSGDGNRLAWTGPEGDKYGLLWDIYVADRVNGVWEEAVKFGSPLGRDWFPDLSDDGNTIVYGGGASQGLSHELHVRRYVDGDWGPPEVIADFRDMGYRSVESPVISGDGSVVIARSNVREWVSPGHWRYRYYSFIVRRRSGAWEPAALLAKKGGTLAINYDGTRVCLSDEDGLDVYDLTTVPPRIWVLEEGTTYIQASPWCCGISDDGRRVAYEMRSRFEVRALVNEQIGSDWKPTAEFDGIWTARLSGDGTALLLLPELWSTGIHLTRFVDGEWHDPLCIADAGVYPGGRVALSQDGARIAFMATEDEDGSSDQEEIHFMEYDFPGWAVVGSNIPNAPFALSGPIELSRTTGPDCRWECDQLYVSTWTVTWGDVPYYETPLPQTQRTNVNETVHFSGEYVPSIYRLEPSEVELSVGRPVLNYATGTFFVTVEIRNITEQVTFYAPMRLVFDSFSPENTRLWNGDGLTEDGKPYIDLSALVPDGLAPGSPPLLVEVEIYNRERNPFISFEAHVTAAKAPPPDAAFTPQAADGGSASSEPRLSEEQSALRIESITLHARGVKIAWRSLAGQSYRVLRRDDLLTEWQDTAEVTATGPTTEWLDESPSEESPPMRVYRIEGISSPAPKPGD